MGHGLNHGVRDGREQRGDEEDAHDKRDDDEREGIWKIREAWSDEGEGKKGETKRRGGERNKKVEERKEEKLKQRVGGDDKDR